MATHIVFAKFALIIVGFWQGECYLSVLRHFVSYTSLVSLKMVADKSGGFGKCI
jgi:hypothetical protein